MYHFFHVSEKVTNGRHLATKLMGKSDLLRSRTSILVGESSTTFKYHCVTVQVKSCKSNQGINEVVSEGACLVWKVSGVIL